MEFLADENVPRPLVSWLRAGGHNVLYAAEAEPGAADSDWLRRAEDTGRIVITSDKDFGELVFRDRLNSHGVVLLRFEDLPTGRTHLANTLLSTTMSCITEPIGGNVGRTVGRTVGEDSVSLYKAALQLLRSFQPSHRVDNVNELYADVYSLVLRQVDGADRLKDAMMVDRFNPVHVFVPFPFPIIFRP